MSLATSPRTVTPVATPLERGGVARWCFTVRGVVQGVGFRPFVWNLAQRFGLRGSVCNTSGAVIVEVEGAPLAIDAFARALRDEAPRLARVDSVERAAIDATGDARFASSRAVRWMVSLNRSLPTPRPVPIASPTSSRLGIAASATRLPTAPMRTTFTIIDDVPYDRRYTTMRRFTMCAACRGEYEDPADRRFHAQPNACPECGPRLWLADAHGVALAGEPVAGSAAALARGEVIALKGLGGFQLSCSARDEAAVVRLRGRKHRPVKPFAVMFPTIDVVRALCDVSDEETALLEGSMRPIVLLRLRRDQSGGPIAAAVAPGLHELGVMLPYTPMHHLLLQAVATPLVMTSGNLSEEPIARDNDEAVERLGRIADKFLLHDRDIHARYDDSVVRVVGRQQRVIRRARGFCPLPVRGPAGDAACSPWAPT